MKLTNSSLHDKTKIPHTKIKRYAREFLPHDPDAKMRSGYTREFSIDDGFQIYLGNFLVSELAFSVRDAKQVLDDLTPWMQEQGLTPESQQEDQYIKDWQIEIYPTDTGDFYYQSIALLQHRMKKHSGYGKVEEKTFKTIPLTKTGVTLSAKKWKKYDYRKKIIPVSQLLELFKFALKEEMLG